MGNQLRRPATDWHISRRDQQTIPTEVYRLFGSVVLSLPDFDAFPKGPASNLLEVGLPLRTKNFGSLFVIVDEFSNQFVILNYDFADYNFPICNEPDGRLQKGISIRRVSVRESL